MLKTSKTIVTFALVLTLGVWTLNNLGCKPHAATEPLVLKGDYIRVGYVCFSPDGKKVMTGSYDHTVRIWDARTGKELLKIEKAGSGSIANCASSETFCFSPDGKKVLGCVGKGRDSAVARIWYVGR